MNPAELEKKEDESRRHSPLLRSSASRRHEAERADFLDTGLRLITEYAEKLDRIVQSAVNIWDKRQKQMNKHTADIAVAAVRDLDPLLRAAMTGLRRELESLTDPVKDWIHRLSAVLEEGELPNVKRMELRLRLTEIESKLQTATGVFKLLVS